MKHRIERELWGRPFVLETGRMARQADGAVYVQHGETAVLVTAVAERKRSSLPFFPLTVEYREKAYAAGKFPGGFIKREGRPGDKETVSARQIDRPLRPLFPDGFQNETQVACFIISADQENDADVLGMLGASAALSLSPIPWGGPIAGVRVGRVDGEWVINPTFQQLEFSETDLVVAGTEDSIVMVEGAAVEISEETFTEALQVAHDAIRQLIEIQKELVEAAGGAPEPFEWEGPDIPEGLEEAVASAAGSRVEEAMNLPSKEERNQGLSALRDQLTEELAERFPEHVDQVSEAVRTLEKKVMRSQILERGERVDGRSLDQIRPITCEVGVLPRPHGSALFTRGQTQALAVTTLGTVSDEQRIDSIDVLEETSKSFMLHYNFPPFSVGEVRRFRGPGRREIGHGMLAERALQPMLPPYDEFPYTIRVVSDILESNGSSSMASVCGGSLSMMDAGVPLRAPVAGIAMGLIQEGDRSAVLTDILGVEDALGDMDFKVAGTEQGITAIQMDNKSGGLSVETLRDALGRAREARLHILEVMAQTLPRARAELSRHAPRIITMEIDPDKIGKVIGPKGKTIRAIQDETGAEINIEDSGVVTISSPGG
ncbi:MAG TPA: polyribonucleotide nucleotidyltransferase, partial [Gemmatimonadota bacterium]|nr:polyribonucleotide nucleotidyltransferase [Gemmatimonadota bacterium]